MEQITFTYLYPRLDANVTKGMNHLLKSPWCVHPKTGKICIPIDPDTVEDFDPNACPTIDNAIDEYNTMLRDKMEGTIPCLRTPMKVFNDLVNGM